MTGIENHCENLLQNITNSTGTHVMLKAVSLRYMIWFLFDIQNVN